MDDADLTAQVAVLTAEVTALKERLGHLEAKIDALTALANQGRGGLRTLWAVGAIVAALSAALGAVGGVALR